MGIIFHMVAPSFCHLLDTTSLANITSDGSTACRNYLKTGENDSPVSSLSLTICVLITTFCGIKAEYFLGNKSRSKYLAIS